MPPCKKVLLKKIERTSYIAQIIKSSSRNIIETPKSGWFVNENGELEVEYFSGSPYPETIAEMTCDDDSDNDETFQFSSDDDEECEENLSDDDWNPNQ